MSNEIGYDDLDYVVLSNGWEYQFSKRKDPISLLNNIENGTMTLEEAKDSQEDYLKNLNIARK